MAVRTIAHPVRWAPYGWLIASRPRASARPSGSVRFVAGDTEKEPAFALVGLVPEGSRLPFYQRW
jgi:hypothetical protein